jgi:hypothetical protein
VFGVRRPIFELVVGTGEPGGERGAPKTGEVGVGSSAGGGRSGS